MNEDRKTVRENHLPLKLKSKQKHTTVQIIDQSNKPTNQPTKQRTKVLASTHALTHPHIYTNKTQTQHNTHKHDDYYHRIPIRFYFEVIK